MIYISLLEVIMNVLPVARKQYGCPDTQPVNSLEQLQDLLGYTHTRPNSMLPPVSSWLKDIEPQPWTGALMNLLERQPQEFRLHAAAGTAEVAAGFAKWVEQHLGQDAVDVLLLGRLDGLEQNSILVEVNGKLGRRWEHRDGRWIQWSVYAPGDPLSMEQPKELQRRLELQD